LAPLDFCEGLMNVEDRVEERHGVQAPAKSGRVAEPLLAVCSAIAWGALAVSLWNLLERDRARRLRRQISNKLLAQVFPSGRVD
jgi:hypothetical protein